MQLVNVRLQKYIVQWLSSNKPVDDRAPPSDIPTFRVMTAALVRLAAVKTDLMQEAAGVLVWAKAAVSKSTVLDNTAKAKEYLDAGEEDLLSDHFLDVIGGMKSQKHSTDSLETLVKLREKLWTQLKEYFGCARVIGWRW